MNTEMSPESVVPPEPPPPPRAPQQSEQLDKLAAALAKAQGSITNAAKDRENPHFKSRYATLASCLDACRKPLSDNGLAIIQRAVTGKAGVTVTTMLVHASGQWVADSCSVPAAGTLTAQTIGSAMTYARRYSLCAMVGIAPDDEDDGEGAVGRAGQGVQRAQAVGQQAAQSRMTREVTDPKTGEVRDVPVEPPVEQDLLLPGLKKKVLASKTRAEAYAIIKEAPTHLRASLTALLPQVGHAQ